MHKRGFFIAARVLISSVFVGLGLESLLTAAGVLGRGSEPASTGALAFGIFELIAGLLVMLGWQLRWVAGLLAIFLLVDAFIAHAFWRYPTAEQHGQLLHFLKNMSIVGGFLLLAYVDGRQTLGEASQSAGGN
jgi:putative oxidoreductase